jgi:hypothetical protein
MMHNRFLGEAVRIGNQLLQSANRDAYGISWATVTTDRYDEPILHTVEDIYSGTSGIALFLLELYRQTGDSTYLQAVEDAMAWTLWHCSAHRTDNYALLTGRMGVAFVLLRLYKVTGDKTHLSTALEIAKPSRAFLGNLNEYINGIAGTLLGLLHLHAASGEAWLLDLIQEYTQSLVAAARLGNQGLYWDNDRSQIRPLCGLSHGASGIGFVFLELGRYLNNPIFYMLADEAFAYENALFDTTTRNWPDFRLNMWRDEQVAALEKDYKAGHLAPFTHTSDMNTWCHGAAGIGLARLRAVDLNDNKTYRRDARRALAKTKRTQGHFDNFALCHGEGGNAEVFLEHYVQSSSRQAYINAQKIGDDALRQRAELGLYISGLPVPTKDLEDKSLFNGLAGVGYFLLRLHDPHTVPSILAPSLADGASITKLLNHHSTLTMSLPGLRKQLLAHIFPESIKLAEQYAPQKLQQYFTSNIKPGALKKSFVDFMSDLSVTGKMQQRLDRTFIFERLKTELISQCSSGALVFVKERLRQKEVGRLLKLSDVTLMRKRLRLIEECKLFMLAQDQLFLLKLTNGDVVQVPISSFCYFVLREFTDARQLKDAATAIAKRYGAQTKQEALAVHKKVLAQVKQALAYGSLEA